jgi:hypothetical protein
MSLSFDYIILFAVANLFYIVLLLTVSIQKGFHYIKVFSKEILNFYLFFKFINFTVVTLALKIVTSFLWHNFTHIVFILESIKMFLFRLLPISFYSLYRKLAFLFKSV